MKAWRQRFACFHEVAAGVEADLRTCIERGQVSMALTGTATRQLLWVGMLGAANPIWNPPYRKPAHDALRSVPQLGYPFDSRGPRDGLLLGTSGAVKDPAGQMREVRQ